MKECFYGARKRLRPLLDLLLSDVLHGMPQHNRSQRTICVVIGGGPVDLVAEWLRKDSEAGDAPSLEQD